MNIAYNGNKSGGARMEALRKEDIYTLEDI